MKKYFTRTIKLISLLLPIVIIVSLCQNFLLFHNDANKVRLDGFYNEEKNSLDVVLLGASDVYAGYSAGLAYVKYGFTSYPFVTDSNSPSLLKSQLKEVLKHQSPQLIVIEVNGFLYEKESDLNEETKLRRYVDNMPMSLNRLQTIAELDYDDKLSCLIPFIKYHSNWQDNVSIADGFDTSMYFLKNNSLLKGMSTYTINDDNTGSVIDVSDDYTIESMVPKAKDYLVDFLEYCKNNVDSNILFVRFPHRIKDGDTYNRFKRSNTVEKIVEKYGYDFISYDKKIDEINLIPDEDFYNDDHTNVYGQIKFTEYFAKHISTDYNLKPVKLSVNTKAQWNKSVEYTNLYFEYIKQAIINKEEAWPYETPELINKLTQLKN